MKLKTSRMLNLPKILLLLLMAITTISCSSSKKDDEETLPAKELYEKAHTSLEKGDYQSAIKAYENLESKYPFGQYSEQAQLDVAYAYYKFGESESAVAAADRFIRTYPRHANVDYAYYLKGLANFLRGINFLDRYLSRDLSKRDPQAMQEAFDNFKELVNKFPESEYTEDSRKRMVYLRSQLANHEVNVARYYMKMEAFVAATNRAQYVIEHYQGTSSVPEALTIMATAYEKLKLTDLQRDTKRILSTNYPNFQPAAEK